MQDAAYGLPGIRLLGAWVGSLFSLGSGRPPAGLCAPLMTEGLYLAPSAVGLILAGVLVLAVMSSLVFEFSRLGRHRATVVFSGVCWWLSGWQLSSLGN